MSLPRHHLELLAPARTVDIAREAILHGADAVYIGGPAFGARHNASNEVREIEELVRFAHRYHAQIFVTLNTILHDDEIEPARTLIKQVFEAGVDALIVQDMGILELDIPPIALHASTQCDIRTPEKAAFLAHAGFSQLVLARELSLKEIAATRAAVPADVALEYFVHGALCVAFSGQCNISHAHTGRSANRGDCSQACRLPYTLKDAKGGVVAFEKHLLSMKDNDQSANLAALIDAGIRSFKIEGRYKDMAYVKNITGHYRRLLDEVLEARPELARASSGRTELLFTPDPDKSFHREHTDYFATGRKEDIGAFDSPKYVGTRLGSILRVLPDGIEIEADGALANGDGLNYMHKREVVGLQANVVKQLDGKRWKIQPNQAMSELPGLKPGIEIHRNHDQAWEQALIKASSRRLIRTDMVFAETPEGFRLELRDEDGVTASALLACDKQPAQHPERFEAGLREQLGKLGNTIFTAGKIDIACSQAWYLPASQLNALRRDGVAALEAARLAAHPRPSRVAETEPPVPYPDDSLTFLANVYNQPARAFYTRHGVKLIAAAYEAHEEAGEVSLMVTKHCLRFSFNLCPKQAKGVQGVQGQVRAEPMTLVSGNETFNLRFDCKPCEMHVMGKMKKHILRSAPPGLGAEPVAMQFVKKPA
ncbi:U32 family peptidase [Uliginosibacterium sp. 31-16]|uniref:peptidase U32 family protein n=1 Tax=Uliginosibacterium sp. 31-16 TaxID=3068315 RepID=UPI00273FAFFA|nr:U32 family peptidase [Uliginosibacterium sp. 31-16]MDP5239960.1 U32 family peptidase [Uliginosibacterium sp. 31-16]